MVWGFEPLSLVEAHRKPPEPPNQEDGSQRVEHKFPISFPPIGIGGLEVGFVVVGNHFAFLLIVVEGEIPHSTAKF